MNAAYVIATSTTVDLSGCRSRQTERRYFAREKANIGEKDASSARKPARPVESSVERMTYPKPAIDAVDESVEEDSHEGRLARSSPVEGRPGNET